MGMRKNRRGHAFVVACTVLGASLALTAMRAPDAPSASVEGRDTDRVRNALEEPVSRGELPVGSAIPRATTAGAGRSTSSPDDRTNIVLILTDDQRLDELAVMPNTRRLLGGHGVTFANAFTSTPLCCPSRATILTGQTSRRTGVLDNEAPDGGIQAFDDSSTIATWLQDAGYATSFVGKYLNGYELVRNNTYIPPGWDDWQGYLPRDPRAFYGYDLNINGRLTSFGSDPSDYLTDVIASRASAFIAAEPDPFFVLLAPYAPHEPAVPAPGDERAFADEPPYRPLSYNVPATPGTPAGRLPPLPPEFRELADGHRQRGRASLLAVDRAVAKLVATVERKGELDNTVFIFTSDNGLLLGEHRIVGKIWAYEESIRVPMLVRVPWRAGGVVEERLVSNLDIAPTIADIAGITPALPQDGRSLVPLLRGRDVDWRSEVLIEFRGNRPNPYVPPRYDAIRTAEFKLVRYEDGSQELFNLGLDPNELVDLSRVPGSQTILETLTARLDALT